MHPDPACLNLIANGDFAAGATAPEGWECKPPTGFVFTSCVHSNTRAVLIVDPPADVTLRQRSFVLIPGESYRLSAEFMTDGFADPSQAAVILVNPGAKWRVALSPTTVTAGWALHSLVFTVEPATVPHYHLVIAIQKGAGKVGIANVALAPLSPLAHCERAAPLPSLAIAPHYAAVPAGDPMELTIRTSRATSSLRVAIHGPEHRVATDVPVKDGVGRYRLIDHATQGHGLFTVTAFDLATAAWSAAYVDRVDPQTYSAFEQATDATSFKKATHFLFLGDSLTDFHRGYNYVDKLAFWLQRRHGPLVTVKNAGVGGDFVTRVWDRLNHTTHDGAPAHRAHMYDALYTPTPTHVFLFLGHNDSKLTHASGYTVGFVPLARFEDDYRRIVQRIRADTQAHVILLSTMSSAYDTTSANAQKARVRGATPNLFGKPDALERYNTVIQAIANDEQCGFVDVYTPSRQHPDKRSLFMPGDGVHISNKGNELVALEILRYLAMRARTGCA